MVDDERDAIVSAVGSDPGTSDPSSAGDDGDGFVDLDEDEEDYPSDPAVGYVPGSEESATAGMRPSAEPSRREREGSSPVERVKVGGQSIRVTADVQRDVNGMKASDYFKPENIPQDVKDAVRDDRESRGYEGPRKPGPKTLLTPLGQPFALFKHTEFTQEEDEAICSAILAGIPLYLIADKLHTSRGNLSRHIKESRLLSQAWEDRNESMLDHVEYQAKRLVDSGNPAMIMFWLERKGKSRGWGQQEIAEVEQDDSRIVFGEISEGDLRDADSVVGRSMEETARDIEVGLRLGADGRTAELGTADGGSMRLPTPMEVAQTMQAVAEMDAEREAKERAREEKVASYRKDSVEIDAVETGRAVGVGGSPSVHGASDGAVGSDGATAGGGRVRAEPRPIVGDGGSGVGGPGPGHGDDQYGGFGGFGDGDGGYGGYGDSGAPWDGGYGWGDGGYS